MNFKELEAIFLKAKNAGKGVAIEVTIPGQSATEFIINKNESIDNKLDYYKKTYSDELIHKYCNDIRIVSAFAVDLNKIFERM